MNHHGDNYTTDGRAKEYEQQFIDEVWNGREYDLVMETISEDYVGHWFDPEVGDVDRDGLVSFIEAAHEGFSDLHMEAEFTLASFLETGANLAKQDVLKLAKGREEKK